MPRLFLLALLALLAYAAAPTAAPVLGQTVAQAPPAPRPRSLFADPTARNAGDVVTVVLVERTAAQRRSESEGRAAAEASGSAGVTGKLAGTFAADTRIHAAASERAAANQSDLLTGTVTAVVEGVEPSGLLRIKGTRRVRLNGATHTLVVSGLVRPDDVRADNTVLSPALANADVVYEREGGSKFLRPGFLTKVGAAALIGLAVAFGAGAAS